MGMSGRRIVIMGAGGRDFHNFNTVFRSDRDTTVVAFTASQIPGIAGRRYPSSLAGPHYTGGIPIRDEGELADIVRTEHVNEVVLAYSDLAHVDVMHKASIAMAAGADFRLIGPDATMLAAGVPVVAVCATRTGAGKSQTSRRIARLLMDKGFRTVLVRHPMPYGDLEAMKVQRFETLADIDAAHPTVEEREEYEEPVRMGLVMYAGVDYEAILRRAEQEADIIIWDGGNNDFPFFRPDVWITVADPLRPGDGMLYHPGELNLRRADVIVVNKVDSATLQQVAETVAAARSVNPNAIVVRAASPVTLDDGPELTGERVLVIEDGPTVTHGGMAFGAGTVAARHHGALNLIDPRPYAIGSIAETYRRFPHIGDVLPAMGYGEHQLAELAETIAASRPTVVVTGTPIDLRRLITLDVPIRHASYEVNEVGRPTFDDVLEPYLLRWRKSLAGDSPSPAGRPALDPARATPHT
jgi:predicted GTPase